MWYHLVDIDGEMSGKPPIVRKWGSVLRQYFRVKNMDNNRVNKSVYTIRGLIRVI